MLVLLNCTAPTLYTNHEEGTCTYLTTYIITITTQLYSARRYSIPEKHTHSTQTRCWSEKKPMQSEQERQRWEMQEKTYHLVDTELYDLPTPTAIVRNKSNRARLQVHTYRTAREFTYNRITWAVHERGPEIRTHGYRVVCRYRHTYVRYSILKSLIIFIGT